MSTSLSVLLTLPFLAIISIPLVISAWITISLSLLALVLRLLIIYLELCFAIIANFFVISTATNISLLNLSASEPSTPASSTPKRLSIDHGATRPPPPTLTSHQHQHHHTYNHHSHHLAHSLAHTQSKKRPNHATRTNSASTSSDDQQDNNIPPTRLCKEPSQRNGHAPASTAAAAGLLGLISGDSGRDFEGLGGWRTPPPPSTSRYHHISGTHSPTTTPNGLLGDDTHTNTNRSDDPDGEDERAWLSINQRLELPSQPLTLRSNSSTSELVEPSSSSSSFWRQRRPSQEQHPPPPHHGGRHRRHHHRSATTSSLQVSKLSTSSLFLSLSSRPEPGVAAAAQPEAPRGLRALSPSSSSTIHQLPFFPETALSAGSHSSSAVLDATPGPGGGGSGGGYFVARPNAASRASSNSSGTVTPVEGGQRSPRPPGKSMVHYSTGLRYRRRSISGPNTGVQFLQP
ncbi:hypothetical protein ASPACDRAFT_113035 [Aspergillus aculeatus ATCC 16872]|uniref:Uncharacterized protein n=1 Tax=Aspergillus aculeatus (strain ATCC 16872 / CBS 172.66 / WB 5094) TaxID=690307 RepID=A0A1L9X2S1_ASPA1|nr:uncharacterized protein ASPACDRAFT_113035 [Aspergillus aculeatus ATCC 16872]OJK02763.1 hypothetical protein ASPACDRAFT_113035 [Aspergillus aculeatus ATCC 16872]